MPKFAQPWFRESRGVWYVTLNGQQINLGPDRVEAFQEFAKLIAAPPMKRRPAGELLVTVIDRFLHWIKKRRSVATFEWYRYRLERLARRHPNLVAADLTIDMVEEWVDGYDFSVTSRRNYFRASKKCFAWARRRKLIRRNPLRDLEVPAGESRVVMMSDDQYQHLLSLVRDPSFRMLIVTTWESGCRPQESLRVEARHVDLANQRWVFPKEESKNKKLSRIVYLSDTALEITRQLVAQHPTGKLFRNRDGRAWTTDAVNCAFDRIQVRMGQAVMREQKLAVSEDEIKKLIPTLNPKKKVKGKVVVKSATDLEQEARRKLTCRLAQSLVPRWSLYALRHSWATHALEKGIDPLTTAILMGHSDPSQLSKTYQHLALNPVHMLEQARKAAK